VAWQFAEKPNFSQTVRSRIRSYICAGSRKDGAVTQRTGFFPLFILTICTLSLFFNVKLNSYNMIHLFINCICVMGFDPGYSRTRVTCLIHCPPLKLAERKKCLHRPCVIIWRDEMGAKEINYSLAQMLIS